MCTLKENKLQRQLGSSPGSSSPKAIPSVTAATSRTLQNSDAFTGTTLEGTHVVNLDVSEGALNDDAALQSIYENDCVSEISNNEDIGSRLGFQTRSSGELYAVRVFGDFLGRLSELRPLHEMALIRLGKTRFVRNYRRVLKFHVLRLGRQPEIRTRIEAVAIRVLSSRQNRKEIARRIIQVLETNDEDAPKMSDTLNYQPVEKESLTGWINDIKALDARDLETALYSETGPKTADQEERSSASGEGQYGSPGANGDSDNDEAYMFDDDSEQWSDPNESETDSSRADDQDGFDADLVSMVTDARNFVRRDIDILYLELRLLVLPASLREVVESVPKADIKISLTNDLSFLNKAKAFAEDHTSMEWEWWPLSPRKPNLSEDRNRLEWHVSDYPPVVSLYTYREQVSGYISYQDISHADAGVIQGILDRIDSHPRKCHCCEARAVQHSTRIFLHSVLKSVSSWAIDYLRVLWPNLSLLWLLHCFVIMSSQHFSPPHDLYGTAFQCQGPCTYTFFSFIPCSYEEISVYTRIIVGMVLRVCVPVWRQLSKISASGSGSAAQQRYTPSAATATGTAPAVSSSIPLTTMPPPQTNINASNVTPAHASPNWASPTPSQASLWVIFGIRDRLDFNEIENIGMSSSLMNDGAFFRELNRLENKHRWPVLRWLSPYVFSHCKFVQVRIVVYLLENSF
jgi:hypothetical protein